MGHDSIMMIRWSWVHRLSLNAGAEAYCLGVALLRVRHSVTPHDSQAGRRQVVAPSFKRISPSLVTKLLTLMLTMSRMRFIRYPAGMPYFRAFRQSHPDAGHDHAAGRDHMSLLLTQKYARFSVLIIETTISVRDRTDNIFLVLDPCRIRHVLTS
jgi:hypothetical protein